MKKKRNQNLHNGNEAIKANSPIEILDVVDVNSTPNESKEQTEAQTTPTDEGTSLQIARNPLGGIAWYEKNYYLAMKVCFALAFSLIGAIAFSAFLYITRPTPVYYAATPDLRIAKLTPLDKPVLTEQGLLNWTVEVVTSSISLDFVHWREKLQSMHPNFSNDAFTSFTQSMTDAGILKLIQEKRLNLSSVVTQAPVITKSGIINGIMSWQIQFPLLLSYESSKGVELTQNLVAEVIISRASTVTTPKGVVIKQLILKRG